MYRYNNTQFEGLGNFAEVLIFFALLEADTLSAISRLVMSMPLRQQVKIVPVAHWLEGIAMAKDAMEAQNQD